MKKDLFLGFFDPENAGISGELTAVPPEAVKNRYRIFIVNAIGFILAFLVISSYFEVSIYSFLWYVVLPLFIYAVMTFIFKLYIRLGQGKDEEYYASPRYIGPGVFIYFFMYSDVVIIYHDVPAAWLYLLIPIAISCFYRNFLWFRLQSVVQMIFFVFALILSLIGLPFGLPFTPPLLNIVFFVLGIFQLAHTLLGQDMLKRRIAIRSREIADRERVQRLFAGSLNNDCSQYLGNIEKACDNILKNHENEDVDKYTEHIMKANGMLRDAISAIRSIESDTEGQDDTQDN